MNDGRVIVYPVITLTGSMSNLRIANETTGESLNLGCVDLYCEIFARIGRYPPFRRWKRNMGPEYGWKLIFIYAQHRLICRDGN
jgi:hypothetical protein